jgi:hypothetical protein
LIKENNGGKEEPVQIGVNNSRDEYIRDRAKMGVFHVFHTFTNEKWKNNLPISIDKKM